MSDKAVKGNKGNIKSSLNVESATNSQIIEKIVEVVLGEVRQHGTDQRAGETMLASQFGKRRHKRGWAAM